MLIAFGVGHMDFTQSLGGGGQLQYPDLLAALRKVAGASRQHGLFAGLQTRSPEQEQKWMDIGCKLIFYSTDIGECRLALQPAISNL